MKQFFNVVLYNPLYNILVFLAWLVPGHSIGWAIIILTLLIRLVLMPSSIKAAKAQAKMQLLTPEVNRIRAEIKDQQEQSKAMMELYKKEGVSPFGSCLPLLIQLPVIFVLYQVFRAGIQDFNTNILYSFTPVPSSLNSDFYGLNLSVPERWVMPLLAGLTQYVLSKMTMSMMPKPVVDPNKPAAPDMTGMMNKQMLYFFPLMTIFIARSLPAALSLYWIVTTLFGIAQQYYVNKNIKNDPKVLEDAIEDAREVEAEFVHPGNEISSPKKDNKRDMITKMMNKKLDRAEKKTGVEVTIRQKK